MGLCTEPDDFIAEKVHWIAVLSDGTSVYQDDNRPGEEPAAAWLRLSKYIRDGGPPIESLHIKFWDHIEEAAPAGAASYYFINGLEGFVGGDRTYHYYIIGFINDGDEKMNVVRWLVPEIIPVEHELRSIPWNDPLLIRKDEVLGEGKN